MSEPVKCGWCGLVDPSPHSEVIHRGTLECVDTQACANRLAEAEKTALERERDAALASTATATEAVRYWTDLAQAMTNDAAAARAEVERLREDLNAAKDAHIVMTRRLVGSEATTERLREALLKYGTHELTYCRSSGNCACGLKDALAGSPVKRKPMFGGFAGVETGALVVPSDERRALAERVREHIRHELYGRFPDSQRDEFIVAIDLDALLGQGEP